ncbi:MAG: hypothetical protein WA019_05180 [Candidatus Moraniibacteriota bacterium]
MRIDDLNSKLNALRQKWTGKIPKSTADPRWWAFRCDGVVATGIKREIAELNKPATPEEMKLFEAKLIAT